MKTFKPLLFLLFAFFVNQAFAQRNLDELLSSDAEPFTGTAVLNSQAYVAEIFAPYMHRYDGNSLVTIDFPVREADQLYFYGGELVLFRNSIFMLLTKTGLDTYLFRFDGTAFVEIAVPEWPWEILSFKDKLYIITEPSFGYIQLNSYDGTVISPVGTSQPNATISYTFEVAGEYLYYGGVDYSIDANRNLLRYDGISISPFVISGNFNVENMIAVPGTAHVYLNTGRSIRKFDGINLTTIYTGPSGSTFTSFLEWRGDIYFQVNFSPSSGTPPVMHKYNGSVLSTLSLPAGNELIPSAEGTVYEDKLFIPANLPSTTDGVISFNGTSYSNFFVFPEATIAPKLFERGENLVLIPQFQESDTVYVFDDGTFTAVAASPGTTIYSYLTGLECFHLWNTSDGLGFALSAEGLCSDPVSVIPEHLRDYDIIEFGVGGKYRDWCWTDIFWDWKVTPVCPVPELCPDPLFQTTLTSLKGKIAFQEKFDQPFQVNFPLADIQSYQLTLSSLENDKTENLIVLDNDLVAKGFSEVKMSMVPSQDYFNLEVNTDKDQKLPFDLKLLSAEGKIIWQQTFTAPFNSEVKAFVPAPGGTTLQMSSISKDIKDLRDYGISEVNYYPNPFSGKLEVDISTMAANNVPLLLSIFNLDGKKILEKEITAPILQHVSLEGQREGFYIVRLKTGDAVYTDFIILKY